MSKKMMGWGAVVVAVLMAATQFLGWAGSLHYLWALVVLAWGFMALSNK